MGTRYAALAAFFRLLVAFDWGFVAAFFFAAQKAFIRSTVFLPTGAKMVDMVHASFRHLETFISEQYSNMAIDHSAEDEFTIGKGQGMLTVKYEPGDVIFFRTATGTPNGYFKIKSGAEGPKLFLKDSENGLYTDQAAEYLVGLAKG